MKKHLFVINPVSGGTDKQGLIDDIHQKFSNLSYKIWKTTGKKDKENLESELEAYQPDMVFLAGGDGTINQLLMPIVDRNIEFSIIPSGSANGLATDLGISIENCLDILDNSHRTELDIIMINDNPMIHMADLGLNATLVKRYEEENRRGFIGYAISAIKELPAINQPFKAKIIIDGSAQEFETSFLVIANSQRYGTGFEINPKGKVNDRMFELCLMNELSIESIFGHLFQDTQENSDKMMFEVLSTDQCEIELKEKVNFQVDGEYIGTFDYLKIKPHPKSARLILPNTIPHP